jgi:hypothetical protein
MKDERRPAKNAAATTITAIQRNSLDGRVTGVQAAQVGLVRQLEGWREQFAPAST